MSNNKIGSAQVISLAALYGNVIIGWIAYYNYQPKLLQEFGLENFTEELYVIQGILMFLTPILAGYLGDRYRKTKGNRLPIISAGATLASMVFMSVALTLATGIADSFSLILPVLIIIWIFSMALFTSPAISTLELYVPEEKLPQATALLTIVFGVLYALEPIIVDLVDWFGGPVTFVFGGVAVSVSFVFMRKYALQVFDQVKGNLEQQKSDFFSVFTFGIAFGCLLTVVMNLLPEKIHQIDETDLSGDFGASIFLLVSAILAVPMSNIVSKQGLVKSLITGLIGGFLSVSGLFSINIVVVDLILLITFVISFTLLSVSTLPFVVSRVSPAKKVIGVGVFYAGVELPNGILEAYLIIQQGI